MWLVFVSRFRYGGFYVYTITVPLAAVDSAKAFVHDLCSTARLTYSVAGTLKYEFPTHDVKLSGVFSAMDKARGQLEVLDWAIANATLEEVRDELIK